MPAIRDLLGHKHVALEAPGVGLVTLLQDHNFLPHVVVCKVNPEVGPSWRRVQLPRYWAPEPRQAFYEGDPVSQGRC